MILPDDFSDAPHHSQNWAAIMRALGWKKTQEVMVRSYQNKYKIFFGPAYSLSLVRKSKKIYRDLEDTSTKQTLAHQVFQLCRNTKLSLNINDGLKYLENKNQLNRTIKEKFIFSSYMHLPTNNIEKLKKIINTPHSEYVDDIPKEGYARIFFPGGMPIFSAMTAEQKSYLNLKYEASLRDGKQNEGQANQKMVSDKIDERIDEIEDSKSDIDVLLTCNRMLTRHILEYGLMCIHYFGAIFDTFSRTYNTEDESKINHILLAFSSKEKVLPKKLIKLLELRYIDITISRRSIDRGWSLCLARLIPVHSNQYKSVGEPQIYISKFISKSINSIKYNVENVTLLLYAFKHVLGDIGYGHSKLIQIASELRRIGPGIVWATFSHAIALIGCAMLLSLFGTISRGDIEFGEGYKRAARIGLAKRENGIRKFVGAFGKALKRSRKGGITMCAREMAGLYRILSLDNSASALSIAAAVVNSLVADDSKDDAIVMCEIGDGAVKLSLENIPDYREQMEHHLSGLF